MSESTTPTSPAESALEDTLRAIVKSQQLPSLWELEPGALLRAIEDAWIAAGRDGRSKHLSDAQVAEIIGLEGGFPFSRAQFIAMFGKRRVQDAEGERQRQGVKRNVAEAYLRTAFQHWRVQLTEPKKTYLQFPYSLELGITELVRSLCDVIFGTAKRLYPLKRVEDLVVFCRTGFGPSPETFYKEVAERGNSLIVASASQLIVIPDYGQTMSVWEEMLTSIVQKNPGDEDGPIHVWCFREPLLGRGPDQIRDLVHAFQLKMILEIEAATYKREKETPNKLHLWDALNKRAVVVVKLHSGNDSFRDRARIERERSPVQSHTDIVEDFIFPRSVPLEWAQSGVTASPQDLMSLISVSRHGTPSYSSFRATLGPEFRQPVIPVPSPSEAADASFRALFAACRAFLGRPSNQSAVEGARNQGWAFFLPQEFISTSFPIRFQ